MKFDNFGKNKKNLSRSPYSKVVRQRNFAKKRLSKVFITQNQRTWISAVFLLLGLALVALIDCFWASPVELIPLYIFLATLGACSQSGLLARFFTVAIIFTTYFVNFEDLSIPWLTHVKNTSLVALIAFVTVETILWFRKAWHIAVLEAGTDFLTGVYNKRGFETRAKEVLSLCRRKSYPISLVEIDIDEFKSINDTMGHSAGDQVLVDVAKALSKNVRGFDIVARLGGDEFVILFPSLDRTNALAAVKRLKRVLDKAFERSQLSVTFSMGLITFNKAPLGVRDLLDPADVLMYEVKKTGKNSLRSEVARSPLRAVTSATA